MIVVDVETTGLDSEKNSIVSIGALEFENPGNIFYEECRVWDGAGIEEKALEINGFSRAEILSPNKKELKQILSEFISWAVKIDDITLAGENPDFDRDFLQASFRRYNLKWFFGHRTVDLHSTIYGTFLALGKSPPLKNNRTDINLDFTLKYVGLPEEPRPHNALNGAKYEAEAFSRLLHKKNLLEEFRWYPIPGYLK